MRLSARALAAAGLAIAIVSGAAAAEPFRFVAMGDMPYGEPATVYPAFRTLIATINARSPAFTVHVGDIKSGSTPCSDTLLSDQRDFMNTIAGAVLYTPGDNEWTDCHRKAAGGFDPLERLAFLRRTFFATPTTLGTMPVAVERQPAAMTPFAGYPENARLVHAGIPVVTLHVVGSNNNFEVRDPAATAEFFARDAANRAWLADSFERAAAANAPAVIVAMQADMFEHGFDAFGKERFLDHSGFANIGHDLIARAAAFGRPVLLIYGDSHVYRVTRPFPKNAPNLVGLEVYGAADMHAVEVTVDPADPAVFGFRPLFNPALAGK